MPLSFQSGRGPRRIAGGAPVGTDAIPTLWTLLRRFEASTAVYVSMHSSRGWPQHMTAGAVTVLADLVEQALDDVRRRGGASRVEVDLHSEGDSLIVSVRDDGLGLGSPAGYPRPHPSFERMNGRAAALRGQVALVSSTGYSVARIIIPRNVATS
jgi:signal transduction histidine kinase